VPVFMINLKTSLADLTEIWSVAYTSMMVGKLRLVDYTGM
jgi:hypothetical protein